MALSRARFARYAGIFGVTVLSIISILGTLFTIDTILQLVGIDGLLPTMAIAAPAVTIVCVLGIGYGRYRAGSWSLFAARLGTFVDDRFTDDKSRQPTVIGRLVRRGVAWRAFFWDDGRIEIAYRECPNCGIELSEKYLPSRVVQAENNAFSPGDSTKTSTDTWDDVFSKEKAEHHREELALACSQCNFSIPGEKNVREGKSDVRAIFKRHVETIERGPHGKGDIQAYAEIDTEQLTPKVTAQAVWDGYANTVNEDSLRTVGVASIQPEVET